MVRRLLLVVMVIVIAFIGSDQSSRPVHATTSVADIPNPDAYTCAEPGFITFEDLPDGTSLASGTISGVQFTTTGGFTWLVGDFATGQYNGKYPNGAYTSQGTHWAWLGPNQGSGRMDFPNGPASYFSLLVSNYTPIYLDAYDANNNLLETAGPALVNYNTGHMAELAITRSTADIAYVIVHDSGNYFLVDAICTNAATVPQTQSFQWPWAAGVECPSAPTPTPTPTPTAAQLASCWKYNTGPHGGSEDGPNALDFQPLGVSGCSPEVDTTHWVYPPAPGVVITVIPPAPTSVEVGANPSVPVSVVIDHGNGYRSYITHLANTTVHIGSQVYDNTPLGNPSCYIEQGGRADGAHVHFVLQKPGITPSGATTPTPTPDVNVMFETPFCGWQLSNQPAYFPLTKGNITNYPIWYGDSYTPTALGLPGVWDGPVSNDNCGATAGPTRMLDQTQPMATGDTSSGVFPVNYVADASQSLGVSVGPFASDVDLTLTRPDGSQVAPTDSGVQYSKTPNYISFVISNAPAGQWAYTITALQLDQGGENIRIVADENNGAAAPVDLIPPTTSGSLSPIAYGWNNTAVTVSLSATDNPGGSGVVSTYYAADDATCAPGTLGSCSIYTSPYAVTAEGEHTIYFFSVDNAGNYELQQSMHVNIDETPPQTTASLSGTLAGGNQYLAPATVVLTASDNLSGVSSTMYQVDGSGPQTYSSPFAIVSAGTHQVTYYSVDNAGNTEATHTTSVTIVAPLTSTPTPMPPSSTPTSTPTQIPPTSTPKPTNTSQPPALPTSTPVPPAPPTSTRPALPTAVPPTPTVTPIPTLGAPFFTLSLSPRRVVSGKVLTVRVDTLPKAPVSLTLQVVAKKTVVTGKGKHRKRVTRTTVLYRLRQHGVAGAKGHFVARLRVTYNPHTATRASLIATARISHSPVTRTTTVTIQPAPHRKKKH